MGLNGRYNHTQQLQCNAGGPLLLYPRINTCISNVTHFHPAPQEHRYFRSADLRSLFFFATPPSFKLSPFSLSPLISYPMPLDDVDGIDEWTAPLLPSDLQIPAVASLALLRTAGCHNNRSRVYVDDDQCIQRRTNYFNSTAMKPTTWETSESVRPSACLRNVCLSGSSPSKRDCNL